MLCSEAIHEIKFCKNCSSFKLDYTECLTINSGMRRGQNLFFDTVKHSSKTDDNLPK